MIVNEEVIYPSMVIRSQAEAIELLEQQNKKYKELIDKLKEYMITLCDEYADDNYDIKYEVFNKIYYEILGDSNEKRWNIRSNGISF